VPTQPSGAAPDDDPRVGRRAAVLGKPVHHSLSPVLHLAAYRALALRGWRYDRHECDEHELRGFVAGLGPEWAGLSLTMPLKRAALKLDAEVSDLAIATGAANTVVLRGDRQPFVDNTDVDGIEQSLREAGVQDIGRAVLLGAGGTAQAVVAALVSWGSPEITVLVRDPGRTAELRATAEGLGMDLTVVGGLGEVPLPPADVVISTVPGRAADAYRETRWAAGTVVLDVIYDPWPTELIQSALRAGCRVASGLDVLLHQAVRQVTLMTGLPGPVSAMRAALAGELRSRGAPVPAGLAAPKNPSWVGEF
jgi:shikimate dehydrogenase